MVKLSDIELPMIFKDRLLFSYGVLNNYEISADEIIKSLNNTNWADQKNRSLYLAHTNRDAQKWLGRIENPHVVNGELFGDLEIHDADLALKLGPGKAPIGISAEIRWSQEYNQPTNFTYRGFAMVPNPEVKETQMNFSKNESSDGFNVATLYTPYKDADFNEEDNSDGVVTSISARGSPVNEIKEEIKKEVIEELRAEFNESNLMSAERGFNEIKMEEKQNNVAPEEIEEVVETVEVETAVEEVEEVKEVEEVADSVEESTEADFAAFNDKFEALVARVNALESKNAEFAEAEESEEKSEEEVVEVEEESIEEVKEDVVEEIAEALEEAVEEVADKAEEPAEEAIVEVEEEVEEVAEEESKEAEFSELEAKIDKLAEAITKKDAAPMSTAEFGTRGVDKSNAVIDRLTLELQK